jgi:ABC-type uncharacterized transport system ATPase component
MAQDGPTEITMADLFRLMNEMRREQSSMRQEQAAMRQEQSAFRAAVEERFDGLETRLERVENKLEGQTERALQLLMVIVGEHREQIHSLQAWAKRQGAEL